MDGHDVHVEFFTSFHYDQHSSYCSHPLPVTRYRQVHGLCTAEGRRKRAQGTIAGTAGALWMTWFLWFLYSSA